jgi:ubiquinone/menaquinone biosynthesis C-methylase UbiE
MRKRRTGGYAFIRRRQGRSIDVEETAIASARHNAPRAEFRTGSASQLPFPDQAFDAAIFVNSLHHVEISSMEQALSEAGRVLKHGGHLIVIESLPEGSFFETFRSIEDETAVRLGKPVGDSLFYETRSSPREKCRALAYRDF